MTSRKKKTTVQKLEEPMQAPAEILTINNEAPAEPIIEALNKGKLQALISKFPKYPDIADRHPQKIEDFLTSYTITLQELKQTIEQIS